MQFLLHYYHPTYIYFNVITNCKKFIYRTVKLWREELGKTSPKAASSLADPTEYENLFPELQDALRAEEYLRGEREQLPSAADYPQTIVRN